MKLAEGMAIIEAIIFASGDPISIDKISQASGIDTDTTAKLISQLERRYNVSESGLRIIRLDKGYQITTRTEYADYVKAALENKRQTPLSQAAMETLAIVAYNQPVTKSFIEQVRGIDSSSVVNTLVERELLEEAGRLELPGRPVAYKTTDNFLRCFNISSISELPPLPNQEGQLDFDELEEMEQDEPPQKSIEQIQAELAEETPEEEPDEEEKKRLGLDQMDTQTFAYEE